MAGKLELAFSILARDNASKVFNGVGDSAEKNSKRISSTMGGLGKSLLGAFAGFAAVSVFKGFVEDAEESRKIGRLTEQVIKTTGSAAKVTAAQVGELAGAIAKKTGVDDAQIQSASNLLLTFTNVRNEVGKGNDIFARATATAVDMATVLGGDASSQSIALGKALNDPIKGVTALAKQGVSFTAQQKTQIKTLVESGNVLGAQKVILSELGKEFGGAAEAAVTPMDKLKFTVGELGERVGTGLLPWIDRTASFVDTRLIPGLARAGAVFAATSLFVDEHSTALKVVASVIGVIVLPSLTALVVGYARSAAAAVASGARQAAAWLLVQARSLATVAILGVSFALTVAGWVLMGVQSLLQAGRMAAAWLIALGPVGWAIAAVVAVGLIVVKNWDKIKAATALVWSWVSDKVSAAVGFIKTLFMNFTGPGLLAKHWDSIKSKVMSAFAAVKSAIGSALGWVKTLFLNFTGPGLLIKHWDSIVNTVKSLPGRISSAASGMFDGVKSAFRSAVNWIIDKWNNLTFTIGGGTFFGKSLPSASLGTPNIPRLAAGGITTGPTLAMIGDNPGGREAVIPLPRGGGLGGDTYVINVRSDGDPLALGRAVETALARLARERGTKLSFE